MKKYIFPAVCILMIVSYYVVAPYFKSVSTPIMAKYSIRIIDEHEVVLSAKNDTIHLYLENAYALSEETVVFISRLK